MTSNVDITEYSYSRDPKNKVIAYQTFVAQLKTMDDIRSNKEYGKLALAILNIMSYCKSYNFPTIILSGLVDDDNSQQLIKSSLDLLIAYQLIGSHTKRGGLVLNIHTLTQENILTMLQRQGMYKKVLVKTINLFITALTDTQYLCEEGVILEDICSHVESVVCYGQWADLDRECKELEHSLLEFIFFYSEFEY
ncbi:hypothetical protein HCR18_01585 [Wolbachia pipientis]|uniref:hypothetical protein n=1 Tax=Wolbachia pipientis TaxID=955 RepID=UPI0015FD45E4|nr:hypothetical protein [Wolbachia pipientis]MBA8757794.1 hypothetical protein [Wolbachia pipientis]MBA8769957.1 hypothetical protein [Wolbachia pipientis]